MRSQLRLVTQTKHENRQGIETEDLCFCEESSIDRSFIVLEILRGAPSAPPTPTPLPRLTQKNVCSKLLTFILIKLESVLKECHEVDSHGSSYRKVCCWGRFSALIFPVLFKKPKTPGNEIVEISSPRRLFRALYQRIERRNLVQEI